MTRLFTLSAVLFFCGIAASFGGPAKSDSGWAGSDLAQARFGEQWSGPSVPMDQLEGKVVWITILKSSSADVKNLKDMAALDAKYRSKGVVMIATHYFTTTKEKALDNVKRSHARFPVFEHANIVWKGKDREGVTNTRNAYRLPYAVLYGPDGMIAFEGPCPPAVSKMSAEIQKALRTMSKSSKNGGDDEEDDAAELEAVLEGLDTAKITDIESLVKKGKVGQAITKCESAKKSTGDRASQATELLDRLNVYASSRLSKAKQERKILPSRAIAKLTQVKRDFAGTEYAKEAGELLDKYKQDKEFKADLTAEKTYQPIVKYAESIPTPNLGENYDDWKKKNGQKFDSLEKKVEAFKQKNPDSMFCKKLDALLKDYSEEATKEKPKAEKPKDGEDDGDKPEKGKEKPKDKPKSDDEDE